MADQATADDESDPLFEFVVDGPPVSAQAKRKDTKEKWKRRVRQTAEQAWPPNRTPFSGFLTVEITYFCDDLAAIDADNIPKPINDALIGLAFYSDAEILDCVVRKRDRTAGMIIVNPSPVLRSGLLRGRPILHVVIRRNAHPNQVP